MKIGIVEHRYSIKGAEDTKFLDGTFIPNFNSKGIEVRIETTLEDLGDTNDYEAILLHPKRDLMQPNKRVILEKNPKARWAFSTYYGTVNRTNYDEPIVNYKEMDLIHDFMLGRAEIETKKR